MNWHDLSILKKYYLHRHKFCIFLTFSKLLGNFLKTCVLELATFQNSVFNAPVRVARH